MKGLERTVARRADTAFLLTEILISPRAEKLKGVKRVGRWLLTGFGFGLRRERRRGVGWRRGGPASTGTERRLVFREDLPIYIPQNIADGRGGCGDRNAQGAPRRCRPLC